MYASHAERETAANLVVLAMMPISLIFMSAFYRMLLAGSRGESLNVLQLLAFGVKRLPRAVATFGLLWICMMGAFALLAMLAVGVAMAIGKTAGMMFGMSLYVVVIALVVVGGIRWQLAPLVCILEDKSMFAVLKRSNQLVSGRLVSFIGTTFASMVLSYMLIIGAILLCLVVTLLGTSMKVSSPVLAGVVWVVPLVISYGIAVLLPLSAQFLAYYTLTEGEELSADLRQNGSYYP
jgi:hypothetical protein